MGSKSRGNHRERKGRLRSKETCTSITHTQHGRLIVVFLCCAEFVLMEERLVFFWCRFCVQEVKVTIDHDEVLASFDHDEVLL